MSQNTALLIIDMQNDVVDKFPAATAIIPDIADVLEQFRSKKYPVFHIRRSYRADGTDVELPRWEQYRKTGVKVVEGTPGADIVDQLKPLDGEYVIIKSRWSGFAHTNLQLLLIRLGIKTVVLTGVQTPNCIRTTAYDAIAFDFETIILKDCSAAETPEIHQYNLDDMEKIGVKILLKEEYLGQL
jgi:nicotinamidase-related amidase